MGTHWIRPTHLVTDEGLIEGAVVRVEDGHVVAVDSDGKTAGSDADPTEHRTLGTLLPGLIDVQVNGAGGRSVDEASAEALDEIAVAVEAGGASAYLPTLITAPFDQLLEQVRRVAEWIENRPIAAVGAVPLGIHTEGPFLEVGGTHDVDHFIDPTPARIAALLEAARGRLKMVTLAPGRPHAAAATARLRAAEVCVAFGHARSIEGFGECVDAGAGLVTHLFNAMSPLHHRSPGVTGLSLDDERLSCALILDGVHIDAVAARIAYRCLGRDRTVLVTDAVAAAGMPNGSYRLAGQTVELTDGVVRDAEGRLAGSALTMREAVAGFRSMLRETDPVAVARVGASNAARILGLSDSWGSIRAGAPARFTLLRDSGTVEAVRF